MFSPIFIYLSRRVSFSASIGTVNFAKARSVLFIKRAAHTSKLEIFTRFIKQRPRSAPSTKQWEENRQRLLVRTWLSYSFLVHGRKNGWRPSGYRVRVGFFTGPASTPLSRYRNARIPTRYMYFLLRYTCRYKATTWENRDHSEIPFSWDKRNFVKVIAVLGVEFVSGIRKLFTLIIDLPLFKNFPFLLHREFSYSLPWKTGTYFVRILQFCSRGWICVGNTKAAVYPFD